MAILGTGAMARYLAYHLDAIHPWIIGRVSPPYQIMELGRSHQVVQPAYWGWDTLPPHPPDIVLLAVKWRGLSTAQRWIAQHAPQSVVISFMNGMGQEEILHELPHVVLAMGITTTAITRQDDNIPTIRIVSRGSTVVPHVADARLDVLKTYGNQYHWGWQWVTPGRMQNLRWQKLVQNSIINPLTVLANCPNGELIRHPLWQLAQPLTDEASPVARAEGTAIPSDMLARVARLLEDTRDNWSSMAQDVHAGLPTEIDAINGYIVSHARRHHLLVPTHEALTVLVSKLGQG
ncbi:MAG: ketopantoate reductase [Sulfobacillus acidophilus]|uniref:2-dehydropantoate 2-reductase n=1 Tax=Sulfobacillus acidophilus TaxID=53633 RepID=A0A2T2WL28_9FIRM|nr:MAG: ketopantoate reductase [Sulfobacillus acidophilus]